MSLTYLNQDWESDSAPLTLTGTFARSTTNAIAGTDLRGGNGLAVDGYGNFVVPTIQRQDAGSRYGARVQIWQQFKKVSGPTGGDIWVWDISGIGRLLIKSGANVLRMEDAGGGFASVTGATALGTTAHDIYSELRLEGPDYIGFARPRGWYRVWLDGVLELELRGGILSNTIISNFTIGVAASGKCTWEAVWGAMRTVHSYDPQ